MKSSETIDEGCDVNPIKWEDNLTTVREAKQLADEIRSAEKELLDSGWGGYPWEHLGDASKDIAKLSRGLDALDAIASELERVREKWENAEANWQVQHDGWKAAEAELERVRAELRECGDSFSEVEQAAMRFQVRLDRAVEALREAQSKQPERVAWFRSEGVVFDKAPGGDDYWQNIAFQVYTDLCEIESVARAALAEIENK